LAALILFRTCAAIITFSLIGHELTADCGVARVVGADVAVVAGQFSGRYEIPEVTVVTNGADVAIIAESIVKGGDATYCRVTGSGGARVVIVAIGFPGAAAETFDANIYFGASVVVVAVGSGKRGEGTSTFCIAGIFGA